jgi:nucleotide-binding universal stress UspA family protein
MTTILLPTDFSENAWSAISYTIRLYQKEPCKFYLLHSTKVVSSRMSSFSNKLLTTMRENAEKEVLQLKEKIETAFPNDLHEFEVIVSLGDLDDAIESCVHRYNVDLVAMGTKGATGASEILFGSNTTKIFKKVKTCPVLAIPNDYEFVTPTQIAFPTDFNRAYASMELVYLKKIADLHKSKINVIHISNQEFLSEVQEQNLNTLKDYLLHNDHTFHLISNSGSKEASIHHCIEELNIDILAMVRYSHSFIESILREPVIKKLGFHLKIPFLVIPE